MKMFFSTNKKASAMYQNIQQKVAQLYDSQADRGGCGSSRWRRPRECSALLFCKHTKQLEKRIKKNHNRSQPQASLVELSRRQKLERNL